MAGEVGFDAGAAQERIRQAQQAAQQASAQATRSNETASTSEANAVTSTQTAQASSVTADNTFKNFQAIQNQHTELEPELGNAEANVQTCTSAQADAHAKLNTITADLGILNKKLSDAQKALTAAKEGKGENVEKAVADAQKTLNEVKEEVIAKKKEMAEQQKVLDNADNNLNTANKALVRIRGTYNTLKADVAKTEAQYTQDKTTADNDQTKADADNSTASTNRTTATTDAGKAEAAQTNYDNTVKDVEKAEADFKAREAELAKKPKYNQDPMSTDSRLQNVETKQKGAKINEMFKDKTFDEVYDKEAGKALADKAANSEYADKDGAKMCAQGVTNIVFGEDADADKRANATDYGKKVLDKDPSFKKIDTDGMTEEEIIKMAKDGCILDWVRTDGVDTSDVTDDVSEMSGIDARNTFGHIGIKTGEKLVSDGSEDLDKMPSRCVDEDGVAHPNGDPKNKLKLELYVPVDPSTNPDKNEVINDALADTNCVAKGTSGKDKGIPKGSAGFSKAVREELENSGKKPKGEDKDGNPIYDKGDLAEAEYKVKSRQPDLVDKAKQIKKIKDEAKGAGLSDKDVKEKLINENLINEDGSIKISDEMDWNIPDYAKRTYDLVNDGIRKYDQSTHGQAGWSENKDNFGRLKTNVADDWTAEGKLSKGVSMGLDNAVEVSNIPTNILDLMKESNGFKSATGLIGIDNADGKFRTNRDNYTHLAKNGVITVDELKSEINNLKGKQDPKSQSMLNARLEMLEYITDNGATSFDVNQFRKALDDTQRYNWSLPKTPEGQKLQKGIDFSVGLR